jgi:signal peptidase I
MDQRPEAPIAAPPRTSVDGSVKETIESILVAFMLAFIFRAYVVEAFVIPTGSMAPTLLGAHMRFRCPDCGYRFEMNYQGIDNGTDDVSIPRSAGANKVYSIICPNCGYRLPRVDPSDPANQATDPAIRYGDRILVLKYLYLLQDPHRWDVVVFKSPNDPVHFDYTQNYIKRLIGLPNDSIMILDGDIYVGKGDDLNSFKVQTKPYNVQQALWRIVYDNDFYPRGQSRTLTDAYGNPRDNDPPFQQPWKTSEGQTGWQIGDGTPGHRDFKFSSESGSANLTFDATANPNKFALTDWLAYDVSEMQGPGSEPDTYLNHPIPSDNNVSDVKLAFYYQRTAGDGPLRVQLTKNDHLFETQINSSTVTLLMDGNPITSPAPIPGDRSLMHVEMINADYRVAVRINDQELLATTDQQYHPDMRKLLDDFRHRAKSEKPVIRLIGENQSCDITHLGLWRDIYYLNRDRAGRPLKASPDEFPFQLMRLGPDEFFVLGDNSYVSLDARYWDDPIDLPHENLRVESGRVPRRFMLGKAFFVYWPAGFRPIDSAPALAPDFGDMRFIH